MLAGTVCGKVENLAFFENTDTGKVLRLREGGRIATGTVVTITLDDVEVQEGTARRKISVGAALVAASASRPARPPTTRAAATRPAPAEPAAPPADISDILERLRRRRQQC